MAAYYLYLQLLIAPLFALGDLSADECPALGFRKPDLACASCRGLAAFDLDLLRDGCHRCCAHTQDRDAPKRYPRAVLEVCACKFGHMPQIEAFVRGPKHKRFPKLSIKYLRGADPIIKLMDDRGEVQEELSIKKWDTDTIEEFLLEHLEQ
uniref:Selenoprotein F n=1 Tax=Ixodes scapularis TaxID=6945 RepID=Q4PMT2_IXOSC|nr:salivary selenoprotein precursor [Ixodes scapularis]